jgi:flagellar protein FliS
VPARPAYPFRSESESRLNREGRRPITGQKMNPYAEAQRAYTESSVMTAPPEVLVVMLYDGAIRFLRQGAGAYRSGRIEHALDRVRRAEAIVNELNLALDMSHGELPARLRSIYLYCKRQFNDAMLHADPEPLEVVQRLLGELRGAWNQVATAPAALAPTA